MGEFRAGTGVAPWTKRPEYRTYVSPFGPKYKIQPNIAGWTIKSATRLGMTLGGFGAAAGLFAVFFFGEIPRVRHDILSKLPLIGDRFVRNPHPADNPF